MSRLLAIDPGTARSAWLVLEDGAPAAFGINSNSDLLRSLRHRTLGPIGTVVIEKVESYGMAVGAEVFETVWWAGRFAEASTPTPVVMLPRRTVKLELCGSSRAKDANVRQALIDRFGGAAAKGTKHEPGPLYGVSNDVWSALAIAVTYEARAA